MDAPVKFVQIIDFETERIDEMRELAHETEQRLAGRSGGPTRRLVLKDRGLPNRYLVVIEFDSYEDAMRNSDHPVTQEFASKLAALVDGAPTFSNLDVVEEVEL